jgi:V/A-type H+-transporting ATPase subunit D
MRLRHPPGRSGRLWLKHRVEIATTGADLLDKKRRALVQEHRRLRVLAQKTAESWRDAAAEARVDLGPEPITAAGGSAAADQAVPAARRALEAAVQDAVTQSALRRIGDELAMTSRRQRALERRWLPALATAIARLNESLDELEREEATRSSWSRRHGARTR